MPSSVTMTHLTDTNGTINPWVYSRTGSNAITSLTHSVVFKTKNTFLDRDIEVDISVNSGTVAPYVTPISLGLYATETSNENTADFSILPKASQNAGYIVDTTENSPILGAIQYYNIKIGTLTSSTTITLNTLDDSSKSGINVGEIVNTAAIATTEPNNGSYYLSFKGSSTAVISTSGWLTNTDNQNVTATLYYPIREALMSITYNSTAMNLNSIGVSTTNVKTTNSDNYISITVTANATASITAVLSTTQSGYIPKNTTYITQQLNISLAGTNASKTVYISGVTVPSEKSFSVTNSGTLSVTNTSLMSITNTGSTTINNIDISTTKGAIYINNNGTVTAINNSNSTIDIANSSIATITNQASATATITNSGTSAYVSIINSGTAASVTLTNSGTSAAVNIHNTGTSATVSITNTKTISITSTAGQIAINASKTLVSVTASSTATALVTMGATAVSTITYVASNTPSHLTNNNYTHLITLNKNRHLSITSNGGRVDIVHSSTGLVYITAASESTSYAIINDGVWSSTLITPSPSASISVTGFGAVEVYQITAGTITAVSTNPGNNYVENTALIIPTGGWLKINAGYLPNTKISLATLVPDSMENTNLTFASTTSILPNYYAWDESGNALIGNMAIYSGTATVYEGGIT